LRQALARFSAGHPDVQVRVQIRRGRERILGVADGACDLAIVSRDETQIRAILGGTRYNDVGARGGCRLTAWRAAGPTTGGRKTTMDSPPVLASTAVPPLRPEVIRFEFVGYGAQADAPRQGPGRLFLDVGNDLGPGVIDHHHLPAYTGSTARLILAHPDLVLESVPPGCDPTAPFPIVLHVDPDLDGVVSSYLAIALLTTGKFPPGSESLARYVDRVDSGHVGLTQDQPFTLYAAYMLLAHRLALRSWRKAEDRYRAGVEQGLPIVEFVAEQVAQARRSVFDIDAFACPGLFGPHDRDLVRQDLDRYLAKLRDPSTHATRLRLRLPGQFGGTEEVDALLVRDVQNPDDPQRVLFFKDWARTDRLLATERRGFVALSVFMSRSIDGRSRCLLSVRPDDGVSLRGLGALLDQAESAWRTELYGVDDRLVDRDTGQPKPARAGYANSDPWYDGRAHGDTIVDSPRSGTVLKAEDIERILVQFGGRAEGEVVPLQLPDVTDDADPTDDSSTVRRLSALVGAWRGWHAPRPRAKPPDVFLSYPHTRLEWVEERLYKPLKEWRADLTVFFDRRSIAGGMGWLAHLADSVNECRVFLPVYCEEYFRSEYCQWELQLALGRDPLGRKRIVIPVMLGPVALPSYSALIQAEDATSPDFFERVVQVLREILPMQAGPPGGAKRTDLNTPE
jgi:hypothetical protein